MIPTLAGSYLFIIPSFVGIQIKPERINRYCGWLRLI